MSLHTKLWRVPHRHADIIGALNYGRNSMILGYDGASSCWRINLPAILCPRVQVNMGLPNTLRSVWIGHSCGLVAKFAPWYASFLQASQKRTQLVPANRVTAASLRSSIGKAMERNVCKGNWYAQVTSVTSRILYLRDLEQDDVVLSCWLLVVQFFNIVLISFW